MPASVFRRPRRSLLSLLGLGPERQRHCRLKSTGSQTAENLAPFRKHLCVQMKQVALPLRYVPEELDCRPAPIANQRPGHQRTMLSVPAFLSARAMRMLNVGLALWAAFWVGIAAYTAYEVAALRTLSHTVVKAGTATESTGHALAAVGASPVRRRPDRPSRGAGDRRRCERSRQRRFDRRRRSTSSPCCSGSPSRSSRPCRCSRSTFRWHQLATRSQGSSPARSRSGTASPSSRPFSRAGRSRTFASTSSGSSATARRRRRRTPSSPRQSCAGSVSTGRRVESRRCGVGRNRVAR